MEKVLGKEYEVLVLFYNLGFNYQLFFSSSVLALQKFFLSRWKYVSWLGRQDGENTIEGQVEGNIYSQ